MCLQGVKAVDTMMTCQYFLLMEELKLEAGVASD
jgi:hypothetical protein